MEKEKLEALQKRREKIKEIHAWDIFRLITQRSSPFSLGFGRGDLIADLVFGESTYRTELVTQIHTFIRTYIHSYELSLYDHLFCTARAP